MTLSEFKAWFDGFTEAIGDRPSDKQWQRIKDRVAELDGTSAVPFYIERYRPGTAYKSDLYRAFRENNSSARPDWC